MGSTKWPCVFKTKFLREQINPRIAAIDPKAPFAAFTRIFRQVHCSQLDPYGNGSCPYKREDCALAYYAVAQKALAARTSREGLFRTLARAYGAERADNKPLARDTIRDYGNQEESRRRTRPQSMASLLGEGEED